MLHLLLCAELGLALLLVGRTPLSQQPGGKSKGCVASFRLPGSIPPATNTVWSHRVLLNSLTMLSGDEHDTDAVPAPAPSRCTMAEVRKAAGSRSLERLKAAVASGWTAEELDEQIDFYEETSLPAGNQSGKTALQMAAWKGGLANVQYLIEEVGCDPDAYHRGQYSYGKTPAFFAATQSRVDVLEYLLSSSSNEGEGIEGTSSDYRRHFPKTPVRVTIVNNKGQSIRSLAASHEMPEKILRRIRELEELQAPDGNRATTAPDTGGWWNFRASHSDGLEYGDLDPRFLDRPVGSTDVVTDDAVNPTCKRTRKGGFARRNPEVYKAKLAQRHQPKQNSKRRQRREIPTLTDEEEETLASAWIQLEGLTTLDELKTHQESMEATTNHSVTALAEEALVTIVRLGDKQRRAWIPEATNRICQTKWWNKTHADSLSTSTWVFLEGLWDRSKERAESQREKDLLEKLWVALRSQNDGDQNTFSSSVATSNAQTTPSSRAQRQHQHSLLRQQKQQSWRNFFSCTERGRRVSAHLRNADLTMRQLQLQREDTDLDAKTRVAKSSQLRLPNSPVFVDTLEQIVSLREQLEGCPVVAIDTEWYDRPFIHNSENDNDQSDEHGVPITTAALATLQLSFVATQDASNAQDSKYMLRSYVVDLKPKDVFGVVKSSISDNYDLQIQGLIEFLLTKEDIVVLGFAVGHDLPLLQEFVGHEIRTQSLVDLQSLLAQSNSRTMPGLKTCVSRYSSTPLSKEEQCSDWGQRPLSSAQIEYAGLDAAILLFLLARYLESSTNEVPTSA